MLEQPKSFLQIEVLGAKLGMDLDEQSERVNKKRKL